MLFNIEIIPHLLPHIKKRIHSTSICLGGGLVAGVVLLGLRPRECHFGGALLKKAGLTIAQSIYYFPTLTEAGF